MTNMVNGRLPSNRTLPQGPAPSSFFDQRGPVNNNNYLAGRNYVGAGGFTSNQPAAQLYNCFGSYVNQAPFLLAEGEINEMKARVSFHLPVPATLSAT